MRSFLMKSVLALLVLPISMLSASDITVENENISNQRVIANQNGAITTKDTAINTSAEVIYKSTGAIYFSGNVQLGGDVKVKPGVSNWDTIAPSGNTDLGSGYFASAVTVAFSISEDSIIYYTVDGTTPTVNSSSINNQTSLLIEAPTVLKFLVMDLTGNFSAAGVYTKEYFVYNDSLFVDTDNDEMDDAWENWFFGDLTRDGNSDLDGDGLIDKDEFKIGSRPDVGFVSATKEELNIEILTPLD